LVVKNLGEQESVTGSVTFKLRQFNDVQYNKKITQWVSLFTRGDDTFTGKLGKGNESGEPRILIEFMHLKEHPRDSEPQPPAKVKKVEPEHTGPTWEELAAHMKDTNSLEHVAEKEWEKEITELEESTANLKGHVTIANHEIYHLGHEVSLRNKILKQL
jgi:hypothetical protein